MLKYRPWITGIFLLSLLWIGFRDTAAQAGVDHWLRYDVTLTLQQNSVLTVEEIQEVALVGGATTFQTAIPTDKLENIGNYQVIQLDSNGVQHPYQSNNSKADYTFEVIVEPDQQTLQLYFPANKDPSTRFVLRYAVAGALRFYDTGDRLDWRPLGQGAAAPIVRSITTINLPGTFNDEQIIRSSSGAAANNYFEAPNKVTFVATDVAPWSELEVSVVFPHGVAQGTPPGWQKRVDSINFWTPKLQWGSGLLGLLILLGGPLAAYGWWYFRLRVSAEADKSLTKLKNLPDNLPPAVVGALLDGQANPKHILATLLYIADQGALNIDSESEASSSPKGKKKFTFNLYAVDQKKVSQPYEVLLYGKIFGSGGEKRDLTEIHESLFMAVPELKNQIDAVITQAGYFQQGYKLKRRQYLAFGGAGIIMSLVLALLAAILMDQYTYLVACPFLSIAASAAAFIVAGWAISPKTKVGAEEAARWEAFKRFLGNMSSQQAEKYKQKFTHWLPYAVVLGVEKEFVKKFVAANTPKPKWWGQPEEKALDLSPDQSYVWVSTNEMTTRSKPKPTESSSKSVIRRLGQSQEETNLLKYIQPALAAFLEAGYNTFSKAPTLSADSSSENPEQEI